MIGRGVISTDGLEALRRLLQDLVTADPAAESSVRESVGLQKWLLLAGDVPWQLPRLWGMGHTSLARHGNLRGL